MNIGVILAGGKSSRFNSDTPKGLHRIDGKSVVSRILEIFKIADFNKIYLVVNEDNYLCFLKENLDVNYIVQTKVNGTGSAFYLLKDYIGESDNVIVVNSDCFMFEKKTINWFYDLCSRSGLNIGVIGTKEISGINLGKIDVKENRVEVIEVEDKRYYDIHGDIYNTGIYFFRGEFLARNIEVLDNNLEENRLTRLLMLDNVYVFNSDYLVYCFNNKREYMIIVNDFYLYNCNKLIESGVKIFDVKTTFIGEDVCIGRDVEIYPNCYLLGECEIGNNSVIFPNSFIESSVIGERCSVGPFSHLKKGSIIGDDSIVGAFVEVKNSVIKKGVKAKHHAYLGDVEIGEKTNIGCGVIIANYDGKEKHKSVIGNNCFVGSNVTIVSPVNIGEETVVGAGSTIVDDIDKNSLSIARARQINKNNYYENKKR